MTKSVVDVADLNTGARIHPSSSAELCGRGTKMGSWQKLSLPGDQRCISSSPAASYGDKETLRMSCIVTDGQRDSHHQDAAMKDCLLDSRRSPLHWYHECVIMMLEKEADTWCCIYLRRAPVAGLSYPAALEVCMPVWPPHQR